MLLINEENYKEQKAREFYNKTTKAVRHGNIEFSPQLKKKRGRKKFLLKSPEAFQRLSKRETKFLDKVAKAEDKWWDNQDVLGAYADSENDSEQLIEDVGEKLKEIEDRRGLAEKVDIPIIKANQRRMSKKKKRRTTHFTKQKSKRARGIVGTKRKVIGNEEGSKKNKRARKR